MSEGVRVLVGLGLWGALAAGCQREAESAAPVSAPAAEVKAAEVKEPEVAGGVAAEDRRCASDTECTAILTRCSMCEGACTGVRVDRAGRYAGELDCSQYRGEVCNYDCRPEYKIEAPRCVNGVCESVRIVR